MKSVSPFALRNCGEATPRTQKSEDKPGPAASATRPDSYREGVGLVGIDSADIESLGRLQQANGDFVPSQVANSDSTVTIQRRLLLQTRQALRLMMSQLLPRSWFMTSLPTSSHAACLTFDDGPHPIHTPMILDVLAKHQIPATFFVVGHLAEKHSVLVERMIAEGHAVGHHTYTHTDPQTTTAQQVRSELQQSVRLLKQIGVSKPVMFRPPKGKLTTGKLWQIWRQRQCVVLWNNDTKDYCCPSVEELRERVDQQPIRSGDIVLMHDRLPYAAAVLPTVIRRAVDKGLTFTTPLKWITGK